MSGSNGVRKFYGPIIQRKLIFKELAHIYAKTLTFHSYHLAVPLSLAVLILNDWWLKGTCPGVITGKLSDFAGIAVVSLLLLAAYPRRVLSIFCGVSLAFLWWKSPASEPFLQLFNQLGLFRIGRTVDYNDMMAMIIFPVCCAVAAKEASFAIPWPLVRQYMAVPTVMVTLAAILGTSQRPTLQNYVVRTVSSAEELQHEEIAAVIRSVAARHGLTCDKRQNPSGSAMFSGNGMDMTYLFTDNNSILFNVSAYSNGIFSWNTSGAEKANALRGELKKELAARFKGLEYIEPLLPGN